MQLSRTVALLGILMTAAGAAAQPAMPRASAPAVPQPLRGFVDRLYSTDPVERAEAACQIGRRHRDAAPAIPILLTMLHDDAAVSRIECNMSDWMRRQANLSPDQLRWMETSPAKEAAETLGEIGDAAIPGLIRELQHADWKVRKFAAYGLGEAEPELERAQAVAALTERLVDSSADVREQSAWALGEIEDAAAVAALSEALQRDADRRVRLRAAWALGEIEHESAVPALVATLKDSDVSLRKEAAWALGEIESGLAVEGLVNALADADVIIRRQAAWALGEIEDAAAVGGLAAALAGDAEVAVRREAAWALGEIESRGAVQPLIQALKDPSFEVRKTAAWALGEIEDVAALEPLQAARYDVNVEVREAVVRALRELWDR
jgi:HEAT repeat protein